MKNISLKPNLLTIIFASIFILSSCEKEENLGTVPLRVNFFKQASYSGMVLSVQERPSIGTGNWGPIGTEITGFKYEPGYVYELLLTKVPVPYLADAPSFNYKLKRILAKKKVAADATIEMPLKTSSLFSPATHYTSFVSGTLNTGFILANEVKIDCGTLCNELDQVVQTNGPKSGVFTRNADGGLKLIALK